MKTFESLCQQRRSVRKFTNRPVEDEKIAYMLRCALMSPSAKRTCPWEFIVVRDEAKLRPIATSRTHGAQMFNTATAAIVIALDPTLCHNTWMADGSIAAEHILLAAAEQGVGACWCELRNYIRNQISYIVPSGVSLMIMPASLSSSRIWSDTAQFFSSLAF